MIKTALSFSAGCFCLLQLSSLPSTQWLWSVIPALILFTITKTRLLAIFFFALLWTLFYVSQTMQNTLSPNLVNTELRVTGVISSIPENHGNRIRFEFSPQQNQHYQLPEKLRLNWYQSLPSSILAGETWQLIVKLKPPRGTMNPASFDYEKWLFQQNIGAVGYVRHNSKNVLIASASPLNINSWRHKIVMMLDKTLPNSPYLGLVQGLTVGVKQQISPQQWQVLRQSGTSHLLAISGLHIGLAAAIGFFSFKWLWRLRAENLLLLPANHFGALAGLAAGLFYAALAGFSVPTQRALIMLSVVTLTLLLKRPINISQSLAIAALLILILNPLAILSAGFFLSFVAVVIIIWINQNRFPTAKFQWLKTHSLIAFGLTPLLLLFFMQTSLIAPIANFIAIPIISFLVIPLLLLGSLMLWLFEPLAEWLFNLALTIFDLFWPIIELLANTPYSHWNLSAISNLHWLILVIATIVLLSPRHIPGKWLASFAFLPLFYTNSNQPEKGDIWFTLLDVGQGLSAVIQTAEHTVIYDTGPRYSNKFNAGSAVIEPFLKNRGIQHIDTLIVSHSDNDHIGGAKSLLDSFSIGSLLTSQPEYLSKSTMCFSGQSWQFDGVSFEILSPEVQAINSDNNLSCVLKVNNGEHSILLPGDIEKPIEAKLVKNSPEKLTSTILIAPHHGSNSSSTSEFIQKVDAKWLLFATGHLNRYHFPHKKVKHRYQKANTKLLDTSSNGAIMMKLKRQKKIEIITWRQSAQRIWTQVATD